MATNKRTASATPSQPTGNARLAWLLLVLVTLLGAYLRVVCVADTRIDRPLRADARDYWVYAVNLKYSGVFSRHLQQKNEVGNPPSDALRAPGYPAILASLMWLLPKQSWLPGAIWIQVLLGIISILLTYLLFRTLLPPLWSVVPAALTAISPHLVTLETYLLSETLFGFTLLLLFLWTWRLGQKPSIGKAWISGAAIGLVTLTRASLQYFSLPFALLCAVHAPRRMRYQVTAAVLVGTLLIIGAWGVRNLSATGAWSDPTLQINFLHHGMYPGFMYRDNPRSLAMPYRFDPTSTHINKDTATILKEILRRFRDEPRRHIQWYLLGKPISFWSWGMVQGTEAIFIYPVHHSPYRTKTLFIATKQLMQIIHWPLVLLALLGTILCWRPHARQMLTGEQLFLARAITLLLLYYTAIHMIGTPFPRYAVPLKPFAYGMAALACWWLYRLGVSKQNEGEH